MINKFLKTFVTCLLTATTFSCASTNINNNTSPDNSTEINNIYNNKSVSIKKNKNYMFWEVDGKDKTGNSSKLYILGTIHIGDENLYPVPKVIENAYNTADKIVGELSADTWERMGPATYAQKKESESNAAKRAKETGKKLTDYLTDEQVNYLLKYFPSKEIINKYEPWLLSSELSDIPVELSLLDPTKSYDMYFIEKALKDKRPMEGLDSLDNYLDSFSYGSWDNQLLILQDTINNLIKDGENAGNNTRKVYEAYLSADEKRLLKIINNDINNQNPPYYQEYYNEVFVNRNKRWAKKLEKLISEGGTTFVFAGCGHFLGNESVFNFMN